jgi:peptidoglycan/xylan/chitin deacetylase (PgdA/CDA1 family)
MFHLTKTLRRLAGSDRPGALILMYHRVGDLPADLYQLTVTNEHFSQQLEYLKEKCVPMHLHELVEASQDGSLPGRAVAVTFDDGYVNNYNHAFPLLESARVPATIFVTTGNIDSQEEFWWDRLEYAILQTRQLPDRLVLDMDGTLQEWLMTEVLETRQVSYRTLLKRLRGLRAADRLRCLDEIDDWAGISIGDRQNRSEYRVMQAGELKELASSQWIELGAHTVTHPLLSICSIEEQREEIQGSRDRLAKLIGKTVRYFSYPFGDYNEDTPSIVASLDFRAAVTTQTGIIRRGSDRFRLNRCAIRDWNYGTFGRQLENYFNDNN